MRGPEPVEVVQKGHPSLDGRQVRHPRQVRHLLDAARGEQRKPGLTARHDVGLVPEDGEGVGSHRPRADVKHSGVQLPGDAVHRGDHQHQPLGRRVGRRQGPRLERAVHGPGRPVFRLHLDQPYPLSEQVEMPLRRPAVNVLRHRGGRGDRVDRRNLRKRVGYPRRRLVSVHRLFRLLDLQKNPPPRSVSFQCFFVKVQLKPTTSLFLL